MYYEKTFCGIGSRSTPPEIIEQMKDVAGVCYAMGYTLNSGGADGADTAFEDVYDSFNGPMNVFLPWPKFNNNHSTFKRPKPEAYQIAAEIHPAWEFLKEPGRALIARNMHQVLGWDLKTPVEFAVCWTMDGCESHENYSVRTGGTGAAIALASLNDIPVFNLCNTGRLDDLVTFLMEKNSGIN
jgi:hypothetical protein